MSWIVTLTSAMALVVCLREVVTIGVDIWEARRLRSLDYWLSADAQLNGWLNDPETREFILSQERFSGLISQFRNQEAFKDDEARMFRHFSVMLALGFVASLGTVFGLLTLA